MSSQELAAPVLAAAHASASHLAASAPVPWFTGCTEGWESFCLEGIDHTNFGVFCEIILLIVAFIALAILCDDYLMPAIEVFCIKFKIREDVAGALFIALGSSAPEIVINAVSTLRSGQDSSSVELGIGAIIGSGTIAFLVIPAICMLFSSQSVPLEIKRRPLFRDIGFYFLALLLVVVFIADGKVELWESLVLCGLYVIYLGIVIFASKIRLHYQLQHLDPREQQKLLLKRSVSFVELVKQQTEEDAMRAKIQRAHSKYTNGGVTPTNASKNASENDTPIADYTSVSLLNPKHDQPSSTKSKSSILGALVEEYHDSTEATVLEPPTKARLVPLNLDNDTIRKSILERKRAVLEAPTPKHVCDLDQGLESLQYQRAYATFNDEESAVRAPFDSVLFNRPVVAQKAKVLRASRTEIQRSGESSDSIDALEDPVSAVGEYHEDMSRVTFVESDDDDDANGGGILESNPLLRVAYLVLSTPIELLFEYTIPHTEPQVNEKWYFVTFGMSFFYLALFSMIISAVFDRWTALTGLGGDFFGMLLVAAAAELPDLIQSTAAAQRGYASMAFSCLSSQIANISIGMGLSWSLASFFRGVPILIPHHAKLTPSAIVQLGNVLFFAALTVGSALLFRLDKVQMTTWKAYAFLVLYVISMLAFASFSFLLK